MKITGRIIRRTDKALIFEAQGRRAPLPLSAVRFPYSDQRQAPPDAEVIIEIARWLARKIGWDPGGPVGRP